MTEKCYRMVRTLLRIAVTGLVAQNDGAAGFYIPEVGTPTSLGTGGVSNPTNTHHADSAWTNQAGMTGLARDSMLAGMQVVVPKAEFDTSIAKSGGRDGGNAGNTAVIPIFFYVSKLLDRARFGLSQVTPQGAAFKSTGLILPGVTRPARQSWPRSGSRYRWPTGSATASRSVLVSPSSKPNSSRAS